MSVNPSTRCGLYMTPRIEKLKEELFAAKPGTCMERAVIVTNAYKQTGGEPYAIRRAKAVAAVFDNMPLYIRAGELLVGSQSSQLGFHSSYPEYALGNKDWPQEVSSYWQGKCIGDITGKLYTEPMNLLEKEMAACYPTGRSTGFGHVIVDYEKVLTKGMGGIINDAKTALEKLDAKESDKAAFLESIIIVGEGFIRWAERYAELAEKTALTAGSERRAELLEIAQICRNVPKNPAKSFKEAMQSLVFAHLAMHIEQDGWSISLGRFDQYMYPYYKADIDGGKITKEDAWEFLISLWMKFMEAVGSSILSPTFQNLTIGGTKSDGTDAVNELSHLCLDATAATRFTQPPLSLRWHENLSPDMWAHAMELIGQGMGMPALFNEDVIISAFVRNGVSREEAASFGIIGCVEPGIAGKMQGVTAGGHLNCAKALELALFDGRSLTTGKQISIRTGEGKDIKTYEELLEAYRKQSQYLSAVNALSANVSGSIQALYGHCPLMSSLLDDCIATGKDMVEGGTRYSFSGVAVFGTSDTCDSVMALKKLVFEDERYSMEEVCQALEADFDGYGEMRAEMQRLSLKFGNDIAEVDELTNTLNEMHADFTLLHPDSRGGIFTCGVWPVMNHVSSGYNTGALPNGHKKGMPLADGVGACHGADKSGPTALLRSVSKLNNPKHWPAGNTCNIKLPGAVSQNTAVIGSLSSAFMKLGGQELQINVVDSATLRAAQQNPEQYEDLVVRVAGFSSYFNVLSTDVQNEIIARTEQAV